MKKTLFVCAACLSIVVVQAQDNRSSVAPPPPPPPPLAMVAPPPPPPPPLPPLPPAVADAPVETVHSTNTIINELGNEITVQMVKGTATVYVSKDGKVQVIKLSTWNANRKYYEKKYGHLPPPPPPPAIEEIQFSPPTIIKDSNS